MPEQNLDQIFNRQVMGAEMEYAISVKMKGSNKFQALDYNGYTPSPSSLITKYLPDNVSRVPDRGHSTGVFLGNASCFYIDVGAHPEYATSENTTPRDTVLAELIGERIVAESLRHLVEDEPTVEEAILLRGLSDTSGNSWSRHLNYSMSRAACPIGDSLAKLGMYMNMHNATSRDMLGSGYIKLKGKTPEGNPDYRFSFGERIHSLSNDVGGGATSNKGMLSTRDEALATPGLYRRVHYVGEDSPVSPWTMEMSIGTYALIIAGYEQGRLRRIEPAGNRLNTALAIALEATYDIDGDKKYAVRINGDEETHLHTANEIQRMYRDDLKEVSDVPYKDRIIEQWSRYIEVRERKEPFMDNDTFVKLNHIERIKDKVGRREEKNGAEEIYGACRTVDKNFGAVLKVTKDEAGKYDVRTLLNKSPVGLLRHSRFAASNFSDEEIDSHIDTPPTSTRAYARGRAIIDKKAIRASWEGYQNQTSEIKLKNPFDGAKSDT